MERAFEGKTALITGARKGIGRCIAEKLAEQGANLIVCSHTKDDVFERDMDELAGKYQIQINPLYFDLRNEDEISEAVKSLIKEKRRIDILINNAGIAKGGMLSMQSMSVIKETFQVNLFAQLQLVQLISRVMMRQKSGCIINIASVSGMENYGGNIAYGASKAAVIWSTREMSKELAPFGIRVNSVSPGTTGTDMDDTRTENQMEEVIRRTALKRKATPEEIADAVVYLAGDNASFITGHNLVVDGGRLS